MFGFLYSYQTPSKFVYITFILYVQYTSNVHEYNVLTSIHKKHELFIERIKY